LSLSPLFLASAAAFAATVACVPLAAAFARRRGVVSRPRTDRWGARTTPLWGGLAIFAGYALPLGWFLPLGHRAWGIVMAGAAALVLGAYDDKVGLRPQTKLLGQVLAVCLLMTLGFGFKLRPVELAAVIASVAWGVLVMNAVNLIDNMDGLSSGVSFVAAVFVSAFLWGAGKSHEAVVAASLAGALGGFLVFNFPPARIFMGDAGSLFIGLTLAGLTLSTSLYAEQKLSALSVLLGPTLVLAIPLLDVLLVSVTRTLAGRPVSQGGRDHTSHRLVELGFSERATVLLLYGLSAVCGLGAAAVTRRGSLWVNLFVVSLVIIGLGLFFSYLARLRLSAHETAGAGRTAVLLRVAFKRRWLEVLLDVALAFACLVLTYLLRFDLDLPAFHRRQVVQSLPWVIGLTVAAFNAAGLYRGMWTLHSLRDVGRFARAAGLAAGACLLVAVLFQQTERYPRSVFPLYGVVLFVGVAATRNSFRFLEMTLARRSKAKVPVLIFGTGREGELAFRELSGNGGSLRPVGFIDGERTHRGLRIHGVPVLGTPADLERIAGRTRFDQIVLASPSLSPENRRVILSFARQWGKKVSAFRVSYEDVADVPAETETVAL